MVGELRGVVDDGGDVVEEDVELEENVDEFGRVGGFLLFGGVALSDD